ncbi:hypothetical protein [Pseudomonas sp.]|uniref:hypothetical protein n=1 Tax=Pseudomonas sp. TaxID=306 RepID=UPI002487C59D|nr:hypothetical protein [Pseudomonas sp.]MDI1329563.1 hypothetical protein [Pseudomonas sp.]
MSDGNHINIGSMGDANHINIAQHHSLQPTAIQFDIDTSSVERLSRKNVNKGAVGFFLSLPLLALSFMSIVADAFGILSYFNIGSRVPAYVIMVFAMLGLLFFNPKRKIATTTIPPNQAKFIDGRWVERDENGDYLLYRKAAPCNYKDCRGTVNIQTPPPRELHNHDLIGVCDIGGKQHTYRVDFNGIGERQHFDWRPAEQNKP